MAPGDKNSWKWQLSIRYLLIVTACTAVCVVAFSHRHSRANAIQILRQNGFEVNFERETPTSLDLFLGDYRFDGVASIKLVDGLKQPHCTANQVFQCISKLHSIRRFEFNELGLPEPESYKFLEPVASSLFEITVGENFDFSDPMLQQMTSLREIEVVVMMNDDPEIDFQLFKDANSLKKLTVTGGTVRNLSVLKNLSSLSLTCTKVGNEEELENLKNLTAISFFRCDITDFSFLQSLKGLVQLSVQYASGIDLGAKLELEELEFLSIEYSSFARIPNLSNCKKLEYIILARTPIADPAVFQGLPKLRILEFQCPNAIDLSEFGDLPSLEYLAVHRAVLNRITPSGCEKLFSLRLHDTKLSADTISNFHEARPNVGCIFMFGISRVDEKALVVD